MGQPVRRRPAGMRHVKMQPIRQLPLPQRCHLRAVHQAPAAQTPTAAPASTDWTNTPPPPAWNATPSPAPPAAIRSPNGAPDPQFTITGRRPEVSSNAPVEACAHTPAAPPAGGRHRRSPWCGLPPTAQSPSPAPAPRLIPASPPRRQRQIQPPLHTPPAAVKPRKPTIGMTQRAQAGRDPLHRRDQRRRRRMACLGQAPARPRSAA